MNVIVNDGYKLVDISLIKKRFVTTTDTYSANNFGRHDMKKFIWFFLCRGVGIASTVRRDRRF
jgi:hypothetical protein